MSEIVIVNASSGLAACSAVQAGAGWISAYETSMIASLFSAISFLVTLKEMTPAVLVSMSVIQQDYAVHGVGQGLKHQADARRVIGNRLVELELLLADGFVRERCV